MFFVPYSIGFYVLLFRFTEFYLVVLVNTLQIIELTHQIFVIHLFLFGIHVLYLHFVWLWLDPDAQFGLPGLFQMEVFEQDLIKVHMIGDT